MSDQLPPFLSAFAPEAPALATTASDYQYNYTYVPPLAMAASVPKAEQPTLRWYVAVVWQVLRIAKNRYQWARAQSAPAAAPLADPSGLEGTMSAPLDAPALPPPPPVAPVLSLAHLGVDDIDLSHEALDEASPVDAGAAPEGALADGPEAALDAPPDPKSASRWKLLAQVEATAKAVSKQNIVNPLEVLAKLLKNFFEGPKGRPTSIDEYSALFASIPLPWVGVNQSFESDTTFAWLRVAGFNPLVLAKATAHADLTISDAQFAAAAGDPGDSAALAAREGRLYTTDYVALANVQNGNFPDGPKYCFAPKVYYVLPRGQGTRAIKPIAIRCGQDTASYPWFTPSDGEAWRRAKVIVDCADGNYHELISHLSHTHLLIEPFVLATHRQLPDSHPLSTLLRPHFEGTLAINDAAQRTLITAGHQVDQVMAGTIDASRKLAVEALSGVPYFNQGFLPTELAARGVTDAELLYPYRDDALLVWNAIEQWATDYLGIHYKSDAEVQNDAALQAWARELVSKDGGRLSGFGEDGAGKLTTRAYLIQATTMILFTASAQHAAVNFAQGGIMTYTPAVPGACYRAAPLSVADTANSPYLDTFPPLDMAATQLDFLALLGGVHYTTLGDYRLLWFKAPRELEALHRFKTSLAAITKTIATRNQTRYAPYPYLSPDQVPQSINI